MTEATINRRVMSLEIIEPGTFDKDAAKRENMARLAEQPCWLEPIMHEIFKAVSRLYWALFMPLIWLGYRLGDYLEEVAQ